jgi:hypothetical protein
VKKFLFKIFGSKIGLLGNENEWKCYQFRQANIVPEVLRVFNGEQLLVGSVFVGDTCSGSGLPKIRK